MGGKENVTSQYQVSIMEDIQVLTDIKLHLVLPEPLRVRAITWYHQWLQNPGHIRLEKTLCHVFTWPSMRGMVKRCTKACHSY